MSDVKIREATRLLGEYCIDWHRSNGFRAIQFNAVVGLHVMHLALA